jgi:hypothetical protein
MQKILQLNAFFGEQNTSLKPTIIDCFAMEHTYTAAWRCREYGGCRI